MSSAPSEQETYRRDPVRRLTSSSLALNGGTPAVTQSHPRAWPWLTEQTRGAATSALERGEWSDYALGPTLRTLEETVADYHGVGFALSTSNGTAALHAAYCGVGIGVGDEVIVPAYSFHATVAPLFLMNAVPVLCDSDPQHGNIDVADAESRITDRTRAIVVTHTWGQPVDVDALVALCRRRGLRLIEDCSHAHGARHQGRLVGTLGDAAAFSLGGRKMVSGGCGGIMLTNDEDTFAAALLVGHCHERAELSLPPDVVAVGHGANYRMSPVSAAICIEQFRDIEARIATKHSVLNGLSDRIRTVPGLHPPGTVAGTSKGGWYGYKARYQPNELGDLPADDFIAALRAEGLAIDRPSNRPLSWQPMFQTRALEPAYYRPPDGRPLYRQGEFPGAEAFYAASISFPAPMFHEPCDTLLDQYLAGLEKVASHAI